MKSITYMLVSICVLAAMAGATSRNEVNFQGQLTYSSGDPIDSTVAITFDIYNAATGGTSFWTETHGSVTVDDGVFDVILGSTNALPDTLFALHNTLYVQSTVGATVITPRIRLTSVPWAFDAATLDGLSGSSYALNPHNHLGEIWSNIGGSLGLGITGGARGLIAYVDTTAFRGRSTVATFPTIWGQNTGGGTMGSIGTRDAGGVTRGSSEVGVQGAQMGTAIEGALGTEREGVFGAETDIGVEGALACIAEPQLTPMGTPVPAGAFGYASVSPGAGGEFYNDAGPSAPGAGDDWALIIGQGHLSAAGMNPGLNPTTPFVGLGPANVASMVIAGPPPWVLGSPSGLGASSVFVPDPTVTVTSLIWVFPTVMPYPGSFPGGPPAGVWWIDLIMPGLGFHVASTVVEVPVDFVYWLVN